MLKSTSLKASKITLGEDFHFFPNFRSVWRGISAHTVSREFCRVSTAQGKKGKQGKWPKTIPCQGKHREFEKFAKTQGKHWEFGLLKL